MFEYCMGIMMALEKYKKDEDGSNPIIVPIVIYTGSNKWNVKTNLSETQKMYEGYENYKINVFVDKLGEDAKKILEVLEKGEMSDMEDLFERIEINEARIRKNLIKRGIRQGRTARRLEGIIENMMNTIKNMLQQNEDEEKIMKYTNAKKEDIEAAKKELGMC